jgi:hypothetical protein
MNRVGLVFERMRHDDLFFSRGGRRDHDGIEFRAVPST